MSKIYKVSKNSISVEMPMVFCKNEDEELQSLLENNLDMLPGDQIDPDDPCRWLLIKREMPVPSPANGFDTWSVDFLLGDQNAMPTLVECKRFTNTQSRREVVGQLLEYAANGHHYWDRVILQKYAQENNSDLSSSFEKIGAHDFPSPEAYFEEMERKLRAGEIRIVFFLERAPMELRSIVEFLNKQTLYMEILLVEASQHELDGIRVVSPSLFGYTEEARMAKATAPMSPTRQKRKWDEESFFKHARDNLDASDVQAIRIFFDHAHQRGFTMSWGTGTKTGSFNLKHPEISNRSFISIHSDGRLYFNSGYLRDEISAINARDFLKDRLLAAGMEIDASRYPTEYYPIWKGINWEENLGELKSILDDLANWLATRHEPSSTN